MIELKTPTELDAVAAAGTIVADVLGAVRAHAAPGVTTAELDALAADLIAATGARPSFLDYHPDWAPMPYPAVLCTSVNDAVVHGIPGRERLRSGDLLSVDLAVHLDGWCADAAFSTVVGRAEPEDMALVETTERALAAGIAAAVPGAKMGDVAHAIGAVARAAGYGLLADHGRTRGGPVDARVAERAQRGAAGPRTDAAAGAGARARADAHRRWPGRLRSRPRRLDDPHGRRQPCGARRAHDHDQRGRHAGCDGRPPDVLRAGNCGRELTAPRGRLRA